MEKRLLFRAEECHQGLPVKRILQKELGLTARQISRAKFLPDGDGITVRRAGETQRVTVRFLLEPGDVLQVRLEEAERSSAHLVPMDGELDIRYEDEDLLLIHKPAGMVVHPSPGHYADSLANRLAGYYRDRPEGLVVRPVGRLDKDTSGLIFMAKNAPAAYRLEQERKDGRMKRIYLALAEGWLAEEEGCVEVPMGPVPGERMRQQVRPDGAYARTDYQVLARFGRSREGTAGEFRYSLVRLKLHTGRTHQIRVHMAYLGHPLLGDPIYGTAGSGGMCRAALHSARIELEQPFTGEALCFAADLPVDMASLAREDPTMWG